MRKSAFCLTLLAVVALAVPAQAGVITYILSDHPNAALFNSNDPCCNRFLADVPLSGKGGPYGLRVDWLNDEPQTQNQGPTFSVSSGGALVNLDWDDGTNTMTIYGQVRHNTTGVLWDVFYELSGATVVPNGFWFGDGTGGGTLSDGTTTVDLFPKENGVGQAFNFFEDCHRLPCYGTGTIPVGRGWFDLDGTNDWLFIATRGDDVVVPEPATLLLLGTGLAAVGYRRCRSAR